MHQSKLMPSCLLLLFWLNAFLFIPPPSFGQSPVPISKSFPTDDGRTLNTLFPTPDGGYLATGSRLNTSIGNHSDAYLLKLDDALEVEWFRMVGDTFPQESFGLARMQDGNYVMGLTAYVTGGDPRISLVKFNPNGDTLWSRKYIAPGPPYAETGHKVFSTVEGNVVVVGQSFGVGSPSYGLALFMVDPQGNSLWSTTLTLAGNDYALPYGVTEDSQGNLYISGIAIQNNNGGTSLLVVKYDRNGNQLWSKVYSPNMTNYGMDIEMVGDSSLLVVGYGTHQGRTRAMACRLDSSGNPIGQMVHYGTSNSLNPEYADDCTVDLDGNFLVTGNIAHGINQGPCLVKFDPQLDTVYTRLWDRPGPDDVYKVLVSRTASGIATAHTSYDYFNLFPNDHNIDLLDANGQSSCSNLNPGLEFFRTPFNDFPITFIAQTGRSIMSSPWPISAPGLTLLDPCGVVASIEEVGPSLTIFPNPGTGLFQIEPALEEGKVRVLDLKGRTLQAFQVEGQLHSLDLSHFPSGIYLFELSSLNQRMVKRLAIRLHILQQK